jgi:hypothetical protein
VKETVCHILGRQALACQAEASHCVLFNGHPLAIVSANVLVLHESDPSASCHLGKPGGIGHILVGGNPIMLRKGDETQPGGT